MNNSGTHCSTISCWFVHLCSSHVRGCPVCSSISTSNSKCSSRITCNSTNCRGRMTRWSSCLNTSAPITRTTSWFRWPTLNQPCGTFHSRTYTTCCFYTLSRSCIYWYRWNSARWSTSVSCKHLSTTKNVIPPSRTWSDLDCSLSTYWYDSTWMCSTTNSNLVYAICSPPRATSLYRTSTNWKNKTRPCRPSQTTDWPWSCRTPSRKS